MHEAQEYERDKSRHDPGSQFWVGTHAHNERIKAFPRVAAVSEDGAELAEVGGEAAEADVEVDSVEAEAVDELSATLGEGRDPMLDDNALAEQRFEVAFFPAPVGADEALLVRHDEDAAALTVLGLGRHAFRLEGAGAASLLTELEEPAALFRARGPAGSLDRVASRTDDGRALQVHIKLVLGEPTAICGTRHLS